MERTRRTRTAVAAAQKSNKADAKDLLSDALGMLVDETSEPMQSSEKDQIDKLGDVESYSPPDSPFFGFSNSDIPQPIVIKTEPVEGISDAEDDECVIVNVTKAAVPLPQIIVKKEKEDDDDLDIFYGFSFDDLPKPIVIKDEPLEDISAERADGAVIPDFFLNDPEVPLGPTSNVPGDDLLDEFEATESVAVDKDQTPAFVVVNKEVLEENKAVIETVTAVLDDTKVKEDSSELVPQAKLITSPVMLTSIHKIPVISPEKQKPSGSTNTQVLVENQIFSSVRDENAVPVQLLNQPKLHQPEQQRPVQKFLFSPQKEPEVISNSSLPLISDENVFVSTKMMKSQKIENKFRISQDGEKFETIQQIQLLGDGDIDLRHSQQSLPKNIQIIDQNGEKIVIMDQDATDEDYDDTDCEEDREFTVIVEEDDVDDEESMDRDIHIDENNVIEADSIEDILAQFESESAAPRSVSCPNCRKCFVSSHFLNLHISNNSTMCDLCNTQCCSQVNLRNHKNLECDLSKRKRNIDLIAQETAILGRKPIEPEKYYNLPIESDEEEMEDEDDMSPAPLPVKKLKSINDAKYECGLCGRYVKILDSHMKFVHGLEGGARGSKYRCPECSVLVSDLESHVERRHGEHAEKVIVGGDEEEMGEIVRCRHPGCDLFFNNGEEVAEHIKREHTDEVRLACGMGGCDEVFDNRGALKRHRTDSHPELDEFKPVDLEPDDPDRGQDMTVACPVCERKFKHKNTCTVHIKTNHLGWTKRKLFECPDCFRAFDNKRAVDSHREAVHLGIRTVCPLCEKPVTRLDLHVRMVHTELPEWPCPDCGKKFKRKFDLNRHRVTVHLGVRNFPCDLCGKRFADMKDMTRHKNAVHYGMKIKWNSRKNKEKVGRMRGQGRHGGLKREDAEERQYRRREQSAEVKLEDGSVSIPVEYIETVETSGEEISIGRGGLEGSTVILDPVLQSQLAAVQGGPGEPRVLIEADPENSGGLRFVVIQDEESGSILSGGDTVEVR